MTTALEDTRYEFSSTWIEEILRRDNQNVEKIWKSVFSQDFAHFLAEEVSAEGENGGEGSWFCKAILNGIDVAQGVVKLDLKEFDDFVNALRLKRWIAKHEGHPNTPECPRPTPFNSASKFLQFFYDRCLPSVYAACQNEMKNAMSKIPTDSMDGAMEGRVRLLQSFTASEKKFYILPLNAQVSRSVRELRSEDCKQLITLSGVVTRITDIKPELILGTFECLMCNAKLSGVDQEFKFTEPTQCTTAGCNNRTRWRFLCEESEFDNWQKIKIQEGGLDDAPPGTVPRSIDCIVRGPVCDKCKPGDFVNLDGCLVAVPDVASLLKARELPREIRAEQNKIVQSEQGVQDSGVGGLAKLGVREITYRHMFIAKNVNVISAANDNTHIMKDLAVALDKMVVELMCMKIPKSVSAKGGANKGFWSLLNSPLMKLYDLEYETVKRFRQIANSYNFIERLSKWVAPHVCGCEDAKKGILVTLVGGVEKTTKKDAIKLRGDINMCIVGDPGTAKSQLLKFVQHISDRAVYASGKSSTAAGLTASVHKDADTGESVVEAGALILADKDICCIDEFSQMDLKDMVSIHEAMEQQTISISKAGIQATMNARASVVAACAPAEGRYNLSKSLRENLTLSPAILSRFDMVFVILDRTTQEEDVKLAKHILALNRGDNSHVQVHPDDLASLKELKIYIKMAKAFSPVLSEGAKNMLIKNYVTLRQRDAIPGNHRSSRITTRQLESMLRISEAVAKLAFSNVVEEPHAQIALKIFNASICRARQDEMDLDDALTDEEDEDHPAVVKVSGDEFDLLQALLVNHIRSIQDALNIDTHADTSMLSKPNIIKWFMDNKTAGDPAAVSLKLRKVLTRMIRNGVLELTSGEGTSNNTLRVHPNYTVSGTTRGRSRLPAHLYRTQTQNTEEPTAPDSMEMAVNDSTFIEYLYTTE